MQMIRYILCFSLCAALSACSTDPAGDFGRAQSVPDIPNIKLPEGVVWAKGQVAQVARDLGPVARQRCGAARPMLNCDFVVAVDTTKPQTENAFQLQATNGQPVTVFTLGMLDRIQNVDELATVMGHEFAHHISHHHARAEQSTEIGAIFGGAVASALGLDAGLIKDVQATGALMAQRRFSQSFELEADHLGAQLTKAAGYDPIRGAALLDRMPQGYGFLASHPPHGARKATIASAIQGD